MNFGLTDAGDRDFHKIMMQKHMDQKRQRRDNLTQSQVLNKIDTNTNTCRNQSNVALLSKMATVESLPIAGQTLLNYNPLNHSSIQMPIRKKQTNEQNERMRKMIKDQIQSSLLDQKNKKRQSIQESKRVQKSMSTQNGMLDYLQKQIQKRDNFIKKCLVKQQISRVNFIDQDKRKHQNAVNLIEHNYDVDVFNRESDRYQTIQRLNFQRTIEMNGIQAEYKRKQKQTEKCQYGRYLDGRYIKNEHNPITNPMQYHIQNPYLRKKLQRY